MTGTELLREAVKLLPGVAPGPAHGVRRHRGGDLEHQRRRAGSLPAEALGSARGAALPGPRRPAVGLGGARAAAVRGHPRRRRAVVAAQLRGQGVPVAQPRPLPVDRRRPGRADAGAGPLVRRCRRGCPSSSSPTAATSWPRRNRELADKVGLQTRAQLPFYDLAIVGGGPAGLAAAVYGASEGLRTVLVEQSAPGGPGRHQLADRELPRVPVGRLRGRSRAPRHDAGAPLRRRGDRAGGGRPAPRGPVPRGPARRRDRAELLGRRPRHRRVRADAGRARRRAPPRRRRLLRRRDDRGGDLPRPGRVRRRARRTRPARARSSSRATRAASRCSSAGTSLGSVDVAVPDRPDRGDAEHRGR